MIRPSLLLVAICCLTQASAQNFYFPASAYTDSAALENSLPELARQVIAQYKETDTRTYYDHLLDLRITAREYSKAIIALDSLVSFLENDTSVRMAILIPHRVWCLASDESAKDSSKPFMPAYTGSFIRIYHGLTDKARSHAGRDGYSGLSDLRSGLDDRIRAQKATGKDSIGRPEALTLCRRWADWVVYRNTWDVQKSLVDQFEREDYISDDSVLLTMPDGGTIAMTIIRKKSESHPQPVVMMYSIYPGWEHVQAKEAAQRGYVGIVANTRGKRLSTDSIEPFEHDARDAYSIIDWISKQPWCNGKIGMYGGSYLGFSQWSAVKYLHPALKTIVPQVAVGAGIDFPTENGVFATYVLRWLHYVMDNKSVEIEGFRDTAKWNKTIYNWYRDGRSMRSMDSVEGRPNYIYQRWLQHPSYDSYWQNMTPQKEEFAKINIPILTTTGYWDDDQLGAMYYYEQYHQWNKNPNYYLVIGPFDHGGSQASPHKTLLGYTIDSAAVIPIHEIVFQWFDHILKDSARPAILQNKVNFEVMGENKWRHVGSLTEMHNDTLRLYLGNLAVGGHYPLLPQKPASKSSITQVVDLADRKTIYPKGEDIYPFATLVDSALNPEPQKLVFVSDPIDTPFAISGAVTANILASLNKKDLDLVLDLYEQTPEGRFMALTEVAQRASYAKDRTKRQLLTPGQPEHILLKHNYITSTRLEKGSRIVILLGVNKSPAWEVNYGTGGDVSAETIKDAAVPMRINWYNSSYVTLPILR